MTISITKPTVGGSENTWGATVNTALDDVVDVLNGNTASTPDLTAGSWKVGGTAITADAAEINKLDGVTATTEEINKLDGVTATTAELNHTDGVTSNIQTQLNAKASTSTSISAGGGLTGGGSLASNRTISHSDTSSQGSVNNSGNTVIQDISLDGYGHVTSIGSKTLSIPSAQSTSLGAVGTYAILTTNLSPITAGSTYSGSSLKYAGFFHSSATAVYSANAGSAPSGTWRAMGQETQSERDCLTVFVRIS